MNRANQLSYAYARSNPLRYLDSLGLRITHVDPELEKPFNCAIRYAPPQFREALNWVVKQDEDWELRTLTSTIGARSREGRKRIRTSDPGFGHVVEQDDKFFLVDTREPKCKNLIEGIVREITELYAHRELGLSADTPLGFGEASRYADPVVRQATDRACEVCECRGDE